MAPNVVACIYVCVGIAVAWGIARLCFPAESARILRICGSWAIVTILAFLSPSAAIFVMALIIFLVIASPREPTERVLYYCALFPVLPAYTSYVIPFPGINFLYVIDYPTLLNVALLLPLAVQYRTRAKDLSWPPGYSRVLLFCFLYLLLIGVLDFRSTTVTAGLRQIFDYAIRYGVLIYALSYVFRDRDAIQKALLGILLAGVFVVLIGIVQAATNWFLYDVMSHGLSPSGLTYATQFRSRGGALRAPSTMRPLPFGIYMSVCAAIAVSPVAKYVRAKFRYALFALFTLGLLMSDSRGGMVGLAMMLLILVAYSQRMTKYRVPLMSAVGIGALAFVTHGGITKFIDSDPYGTFGYRYDLLLNSMHSISQHALFGTPDFLKDPVLQLSMQGQHIIDVVNAYLQVTLQYGVVGLLLFLAPFFLSAVALARYRRRCELDNRREAEHISRLALAILVSYAIEIGTVSLVDRLSQYYWIFIVLSSAIAWPRNSPHRDP